MAKNKVYKNFMDGFEKDCCDFIEKFEEKNCLSYTTFVHVWNKTKFNLVFSGRTTLAELMEFTEEAVNIVASHILMDEKRLSTMVCAVYLIYALYHKQFDGRKPFVRVMPNKVMHLVNLKKTLQDIKLIDCQFIFGWLLLNGVFRFVISEREYGLEKSFRKYYEDKVTLQNEIFKDLNIDETIRNIVEDEKTGFKTINNVMEDYQKAKCMLPGSSKKDPPSELNFFEPGFLKKIQSALDEANEKIDTCLGQKEKILRNPKKSPQKISTKLNLYTSTSSPPSNVGKKSKNNISKRKMIAKEYCVSTNDSEPEKSSDVLPNKSMPIIDNESNKDQNLITLKETIQSKTGPIDIIITHESLGSSENSKKLNNELSGTKSKKISKAKVQNSNAVKKPHNISHAVQSDFSISHAVQSDCSLSHGVQSDCSISHGEQSDCSILSVTSTNKTDGENLIIPSTSKRKKSRPKKFASTQTCKRKKPSKSNSIDNKKM